MNKQQLASKIWESANKMRSKIEANEYKDYILGFIFYKFLSETEVTRLKGELKEFRDKADADEAAARKKLLDDAENDGRIDATTRPIYENLLSKDRENGEKALEKLSPKRKVMTDLRVNPTNESPWNKRMTEIKDKLKH